MRILHVLNNVASSGSGIVNAAVDLACVQASAQQVVGVASGGGGYLEFLNSSGIAHYRLDQTRRPLALFGAYKRVNQIVAEFQPDIVHCHMMTGMVLAWLARPRHGYRLVSHVHNVHQMASSVMRLADRSIAVSQGAAKEMQRLGIPCGKIAVVPNRFVGSPRRRYLSDSTNLELKQPAIVTVAGLNKRKNIDGLIQAFDSIASDFPEAQLYIVGDGPDRVPLLEFASRCRSVNRIHFAGFQPDPSPYMREAHIFVLASHRESFGLVLQEAREAGAAIVATEVDGIPEALDDGKAGLLVPVGDASALAESLRALLADPVAHRKWQTAARAGLEEHSIQRMSEQLFAVYRELLSNPA